MSDDLPTIEEMHAENMARIGNDEYRRMFEILHRNEMRRIEIMLDVLSKPIPIPEKIELSRPLGFTEKFKDDEQ